MHIIPVLGIAPYPEVPSTFDSKKEVLPEIEQQQSVKTTNRMMRATENTFPSKLEFRRNSTTSKILSKSSSSTVTESLSPKQMDLSRENLIYLPYDVQSKAELKKLRDIIIRATEWEKIGDKRKENRAKCDEKIATVKAEYRQIADAIEIQQMKEKILQLGMWCQNLLSDLERKMSHKLRFQSSSRKRSKIEKKYVEKANSLKKDFNKMRDKLEKNLSKLQQPKPSLSSR
jgi:hypothetical protein